MTVAKTSFHINGFWKHVSLISSNVYRDQHNEIWILKGNRFYSECGGFVSDPIEQKKKVVLSSAKDIFLHEREAYHEFFQSRYYMNM